MNKKFVACFFVGFALLGLTFYRWHPYRQGASIHWADAVSQDTIVDSWHTWKTNFSDRNPAVTRDDFMHAVENGEYVVLTIDKFLGLKVENQRLDRYRHATTAQEAYPIADRPRHQDDIKSVNFFLQTTSPVSPILVARVHEHGGIRYIKLDGVHRLIAAAIKKSPIKVLFVDL